MRKSRSILILLVMLSLVLMSACDTNPPPPAATPTTAAPAATATTASNTGQPTTAPSTAKGNVKSGTLDNIVEIQRDAPKGNMTNRNADTSKRTTTSPDLDELNSAPAVEGTPEPGGFDAPLDAAVDIPEDWSVILESDFSENDAGTWTTFEGDDFSATVEDGVYKLSASNGAAFYAWAEETANWDNGYISATFSIKGSSVVGLAARAVNDSGNWTDFDCLINNSGNYGCFRQVAGELSLVDKGTSSAIKKNGTNTLGLLANGSEITFVINGKKIKSFQEEEITEGAFGFLITSAKNSTTTASISKALFMGPGEPADTTPTPAADETETPVVDETETPSVDETETPAVDKTPSPAGRTATPTPSSGDGDVISKTDFSEGEGDWNVEEGDIVSTSIEDGKYVVNVKAANNISANTISDLQGISDARIEVGVQVEDTSTAKPGWVGVIARSQVFETGGEDWSQIFCGVNNLQSYSCLKLGTNSSGAITAKELLKGKSSSIKKNAENILSLTGQGSRWTLEVNGTKLGSFTDGSLTEGHWGLMVFAGAKGTIGRYSKVDVYSRGQ